MLSQGRVNARLTLTIPCEPGAREPIYWRDPSRQSVNMATADNSPPNSPASTNDLPPGLDVGGYEITHLLGEGGMGQVYAAVHPVIGKKVAIKLLAPHCMKVPDLVHRFIEEARAVNTIGHANIIDIFSFGQLPDGRHYMVMEYLNGETLADRLNGSPIALPDLRRWLQQICAALEAVHAAGFVHRDLKPENIWITTKAHGETAIKLLDFGIAKLLGIGNKRITQTGATVGTPGFMSPEQCMARGVDQRADIYSFGVILYLIFTGTMPFAGGSLSDIVHSHTSVAPEPPSRRRPMPPGLEALILDCLAKDPFDRPANARTLAQRLEAALTSPGASAIVAGCRGTGLGTQRIETAEPAVSVAAKDTRVTPTRRIRPPWLLILGLLVAAVGIFFLFDRKVPAREVELAAAQALARARDGLGTQARALANKAQVAAAVHKLVVALDVGEDDVATFQDLFATEDWWQPFRTAPLVSALVTDKRLLAATDPDLADVKDAEIIAWARAGKDASGVVRGRAHTYVAAAAPVTGFRRRPPDGPVVLVAQPLDPSALLALAGSPDGAVGVAESGTVLEVVGAEQARRALTQPWPTDKGEAADRKGVLITPAFAGVALPVGGKVTLLSVFPAPPARGAPAGLPLLLVGAALLILGLVVRRGPDA